MKIVEEELWKLPPTPGMIVVTTNGVISKRGDLVMGVGAAGEARTHIDGVAFQCAEKIRVQGIKVAPGLYSYGFLPILCASGKTWFGIFQTKLDWAENADKMLIHQSCMKLADYLATQHGLHVRMNFPGIGAGHLSRSDIEPLLSQYLGSFDVTLCVKPDRRKQ
jgi:hypothetical protein